MHASENAIGGPKVLQKQKVPDEFVKYECTVSKVSSIEARHQVQCKKLFLRKWKQLLHLDPGCFAVSPEVGNQNLLRKKDPVVEETVSMAVLAREDDYEDEYNQVDEWENETPQVEVQFLQTRPL